MRRINMVNSIKIKSMKHKNNLNKMDSLMNSNKLNSTNKMIKSHFKNKRCTQLANLIQNNNIKQDLIITKVVMRNRNYKIRKYSSKKKK